MIAMPEVRMTVEEYLSLIEGAHTAVGTKALSPVVGKARAKAVARTGAKIQRKARGTAIKGMSSALKKANKMARKRNGSFKKGWSQAKVMKKAHQIRRRAR